MIEKFCDSVKMATEAFSEFSEAAKIDREAVLRKFGRRAYRLIADAEPGDELTASIAFLRIPRSDLYRWRAAGLLSGGDGSDPFRFEGVPE